MERKNKNGNPTTEEGNDKWQHECGQKENRGRKIVKNIRDFSRIS
jgi:hypothetical protein